MMRLPRSISYSLYSNVSFERRCVAISGELDNVKSQIPCVHNLERTRLNQKLPTKAIQAPAPRDKGIGNSVNPAVYHSDRTKLLIHVSSCCKVLPNDGQPYSSKSGVTSRYSLKTHIATIYLPKIVPPNECNF